MYQRSSHGSGVPESTPKGFWVFLSDPDLESKTCEKTYSESIFNFDSRTSERGHFSSKNMGNFRLDRWKLESEQESDSEI